MGNLNKANPSQKVSLKNNLHNVQKRYSYNSKENKKGLSQFNLNGLITLGGNSVFTSKKNVSKEPTWNKERKTQNLTMNTFKKNFSNKQKVFYSSMNQYNNQFSTSKK